MKWQENRMQFLYHQLKLFSNIMSYNMKYFSSVCKFLKYILVWKIQFYDDPMKMDVSTVISPVSVNYEISVTSHLLSLCLDKAFSVAFCLLHEI